MATSNSNTFGITTQIDKFVREIFARIGIEANRISQAYAEEAIFSSNLTLSAWMGNIPTPWMRKQQMVSLYNGQATYQLPATLTNIVDVIAIQPQRLNTGGSAISSTVASGSAANVFDPNVTGGCTLADANGYIGYDYGTENEYSVTYVGIQPLNNSSVYKIAVQYSFDGTQWITLNSPELINYNQNQVGWIVLTNSLNARYWRILETSGATLAIEQLYFSQPQSQGQGDRALGSLSYTQWMQLANKQIANYVSTSYFFNQQINPTITLWPVPGSQSNIQYTALLYTGYFYPQDVVYLFEQFDVPRRFLDALVADVAFRLSEKPFFNVSLDKVMQLEKRRDEAYQQAAVTNQSNSPLSINPDFAWLRP